MARVGGFTRGEVGPQQRRVWAGKDALRKQEEDAERAEQERKAVRMYQEMAATRRAMQMHDVFSARLKELEISRLARLPSDQLVKVHNGYWGLFLRAHPYSIEKAFGLVAHRKIINLSMQNISNSLIVRYDIFRRKRHALRQVAEAHGWSKELKIREKRFARSMANIERFGTMSSKESTRLMLLWAAIVAKINVHVMPPKNLDDIVSVAIKSPPIRKLMEKGNITDIRQLVGDEKVDELNNTIERLFTQDPILGDTITRYKETIDTLIEQADQEELSDRDRIFSYLLGNAYPVLNDTCNHILDSYRQLAAATA